MKLLEFPVTTGWDRQSAKDIYKELADQNKSDLPQAAQAEAVVVVIILPNSGHGANLRVCMGIFTIWFRRQKIPITR